MIFEFANGGTLRNHLARHFHSLTWDDKYKLSLDITNGLKYMHELDVIHKDLVIRLYIVLLTVVLIIILIIIVFFSNNYLVIH